jgi:hypothetical protein
VIREGEDVLVRLDGANLPDFKKSLFTLSYDPDVLSFRSAELGEFFDDDPAASIYYAQPDKSDGKALLAIDSNTEVAELSGDGPLVYARFQAKQDIEQQSDTKLAMVLDNTARYILDRNGDNILPVPVERQPLRSAITAPPAQANTKHEEVPTTATTPALASGTAAPQQPTGGGLLVSPGSAQPQQQQSSSQSNSTATQDQGGGAHVQPNNKKAGSAATDTGTPVAPQRSPSLPPGTEVVPSSPTTDSGSMVGPLPPAADQQKQDEEAEATGTSGKSR